MEGFRGYLRRDGRKGIRNVVLVAYLVECARHVAEKIVAHFDSTDVQLAGFSGCAPNDYANEMMVRICTHPNVGGVLLVSLGCENLDREGLFNAVRASGRPAGLIVIQENRGTMTSIAYNLKCGLCPKRIWTLANLLSGRSAGDLTPQAVFLPTRLSGKLLIISCNRGRPASLKNRANSSAANICWPEEPSTRR